MDLSHLTIDSRNITIQNGLNISNAGENTITARDLNLSDIYEVTVWGYCYANAEGERHCTKSKFDWASSFDGEYLGGSDLPAAVKIKIPDDIKDSITLFRSIARNAQAVLIAASPTYGGLVREINMRYPPSAQGYHVNIGMEAAGLVVGVAGLAGLFNSCLEAVDKVQSYQTFGADSHILETRFQAAKARFERWGQGVGIEKGKLQPDHHLALDDKETSTVVTDVLHIIIKAICDARNAPPRRTRAAGPGDDSSSLHGLKAPYASDSRRRKLTWALWGKGARTEQVELFEKLVQELHNLQRVNNTCNWILERPAFRHWLATDVCVGPKLLWINGPAGFGKTILCAHIVEHLTSNLDTPIAQFFFTSDSEGRDDPYLALRSWVSQIVSHHESAYEHVRKRWESDTDPLATRATIITVFKELLDVVARCTFVADGLDECAYLDNSSTSVAKFVHDVTHAVAGTNARILFVSRDEHKIRRALVVDARETFAEYTILPEDVRSDNAAYSQSIVNRRLPNKSDDLRATLSEAMTDRCRGQLLWLKMQEESLREGMNKKRLQDAIANTPTGLDHLYDRNWTRVIRLGEWERHRAFALLRWTAFALRPLTVCEITEAALIDESEDFPLEDLPDDVDDAFVNSEIIGLCGPLLEVRNDPIDPSPSRRTVHLPHFSVRQYLLYQLPTPGWIRQNDTLRTSYEQLQNTLLAKACLQYVSFRQVWEDIPHDSLPSTGMSFRSYAATTWYQHVNLGLPKDAEIARLSVRFLSRNNPAWDSWRALIESQNAERQEQEAETIPPGPLYYAVELGLTDVAISLITEQNVNETTSLGRSAVLVACANGYIDIVHVLLDKGADITVTNKYGCTPVDAASENGHAEVVRLLLEKGADIATADNEGWTPVNAASNNGHAEVVKLLLEKGADITIASNEGWTPVNSASNNGHAEVVKLLLEKGADIATANKYGCTPVNAASTNGHAEVVKLLLEKGANIATANKYGWTPVNAASNNGHAEVVKLLLEKGGGSTIASNNGWTPVNSASNNGHAEVVKLLLEKGADIATADNEGWTPVNVASKNGHAEVVKLLLEKGADIATASNSGWTPVNSASNNGHAGVVKLLLEKGADIATANKYGCTPVNAASTNGHAEVVKLLLEKGANIATANKYGWTPVNAASNNGHAEVVKLLLEKGGGSTIASNDGWTPVNSASENGHAEAVKLPPEHGTDSTVANKHGGIDEGDH
ncbi:ankyrin repeat domain-containing protein 52 [Purpureocillium lavendulum]|uniref:Ankyrin repeat domain-containing protein 52 n=1 Tax=Purpureocillium lavendulum TaxID=1247861 RepID=A0AB34FJF3_9HYPO|nr:ankyrin repeat domain-containing protein 52 [Purpureocillium lavendulum]